MTHPVLTSEQAARIPAAAIAIVELLNSRPHAIHADRLDDAAYTRAMITRLAPGEGEPTSRSLDELRRIRADLTSVVTSASPDNVKDGWVDFTAHTAGVILQQDFSIPGTVSLRQVAGDPVVGGVALAVAELVSSGAWSRVRFCANPNCEGAFYDTTRSRTQRWDSYDTCGNRSNVAAYRSRARGRQNTTGGPAD
jgi:predicted RNA-binding Zn ribbon-like protein